MTMARVSDNLPPALAALEKRLPCQMNGDCDGWCSACQARQIIVATLRAVAEEAVRMGGVYYGQVTNWADIIEGRAP